MAASEESVGAARRAILVGLGGCLPVLEATAESRDSGPGQVAVVQTFGDRANFHPHVHALVTRGGWTSSGEWVPAPYVDERAAEGLLRHEVLGLLRGRGLLSPSGSSCSRRGGGAASP